MEVREERRPTSATAEAAAERGVLRVEGLGKERPFRGVRMRKWGKWVAEIREPNKRSRIWLGSYSSPVAAARAYDTAVYLLRGRSARLNFPEEIKTEEAENDLAVTGGLTAATIRKKATEVGARVDALQASLAAQQQQLPRQPSPQQAGKSGSESTRSCKNPDLNQQPSPETSNEE
ncbi:hypothetical protein HPP92_017370 [Vanilla planifolia]|nr:hypothetical protein HPP92_017370 [Vanilla planifolia]